MSEGRRGKERPREWVGERGSEALVVGKLSLELLFLSHLPYVSLPSSPFLSQTGA